MQQPVPLKLKTPLENPKRDVPRWPVSVQSLSGEMVQVADPDITRALVAMMDMEATLGGAASHYGGPAGFAEIMSALHGLVLKRSQEKGAQWHQLFHLVNDAGHCENGLYALRAHYDWSVSLEDLKKFRSIESPLTGHGEAEIFPEGVWISNGPLGSGLPQAQGLAAADAWAGRMDRLTVCALSDGACFEGEAREAMAAIPGLAQKGQLAPFVVVISDNKIKLSGKVEDSYSLESTFQSLQALGWELIDVADGHNLQDCYQALEKAMDQVLKNPKKPVALRFHTIKGKGARSTESATSGGHGFPLKKSEEITAFVQEIVGGKSLPSEIQKWLDELSTSTRKPAQAPQSVLAKDVAREKIQVGVAAALKQAAEKGWPVVSVSSDLSGSTGLGDFQKAFPSHCLDVGVAEANMVSTAIGMSKVGYIPVVDTFAQFGATKGALPMIMAQLSLGPIIAVYSHTGFQDAADGASHQSITYLSKLKGIPHVDTYALTTSEEAHSLVFQAVEEFKNDRESGKVPRSKVFFLGRENFPRTYFADGTDYRLGQPQVVFETPGFAKSSLVIVAAGSLLEEGVRAAELLQEQGLGARVINPSVLNHFPSEFYSRYIPQGAKVVSLEDHRLMGGFAADMVQALLLQGHKFEYRGLGVGDEFGRSAYASFELYRVKGLDAPAVVRSALQLMGSSL